MAASLPARHDAYGPTDLSEHQFRLFRLQHTVDDATGQSTASPSARTDASIQCELVAFSFAEQPLPGFVAVSYRWGTEEYVFPIELNGHVFMVRDNLYNFLLQMASEKSKDWFFVDAICINQDYNLEKASQVNMMGAIYKNAAKVLVWMGSEPVGELSADDEDAELLRAVSTNRFWTRLWPIQEVLLARRLVVRLGRKQVPWWRIVSKNSSMLKADKTDRPVRPPVENVWFLQSTPENLLTAL
jgi:hypothetical protein